MQSLNDQNQKVITNVKQRHEKDIQRQNEAFENDIKGRTERHNVKREKVIAAHLKDLSTLEQAHDQQMQDQELSFEKRFQANDQEARRTFTNQAVQLGQELQNQKERFVKASDKYKNKTVDPFYQVRDNKTELVETSGAYVFKAKVPEHEKDDVHVKVKQNKVTLSGNRSFDEKIEQDGHVVKTNNTQTFQESYNLPRRIKEDEIIKQYDGGVLKITIPKVYPFLTTPSNSFNINSNLFCISWSRATLDFN
jgi:HSP20 family molecular chaperone IbpA